MRGLRAFAIFLCGLLAGCAKAPSISVLGAYFPDWLFCIVGAFVLASILLKALRSSGLIEPQGWVVPLVYAALTVTLALIGWLIFFKN